MIDLHIAAIAELSERARNLMHRTRDVANNFLGEAYHIEPPEEACKKEISGPGAIHRLNLERSHLEKALDGIHAELLRLEIVTGLNQTATVNAAEPSTFAKKIAITESDPYLQHPFARANS